MHEISKSSVFSEMMSYFHVLKWLAIFIYGSSP